MGSAITTRGSPITAGGFSIRTLRALISLVTRQRQVFAWSICQKILQSWEKMVGKLVRR